MSSKSKRKYAPDGLQEYEGCNFLKQRLICSLLSRNPVKITNLRPMGIKEFERCLLDLIEKITGGTKYTIHPNNNEIFFVPGALEGGEITHECDLERSIGYYLELLVAVAPFCKEPIDARLFGITNGKDATSVDFIKRNTMAWMKEVYNIDEGLDLKIVKRGMVPDGGGEVIFNCPIRKEMPAVQMIDEGIVKRIRGVAYSCKVPASVGNRMIEASKGFFLDYLQDIYIHTDQMTGKQSGNSPGFGIYLEAETTTGVIYSSEMISEASEGKHETAEDLAIEACKLLLEEIYAGGCVDSANQWLVILYMALSKDDVSKVIVGQLNDYSIEFLRHMLDFFSIKYKVEWHIPDRDDQPDSDTDSDEEKDKPDAGESEELPARRRHREESDEEVEEVQGNANSCEKQITEENARVLLACLGLGYKNTNRIVL